MHLNIREIVEPRFSFPNLDFELGTRKYANCNSLRENLLIMVTVEPLALVIMEGTIW